MTNKDRIPSVRVRFIAFLSEHGTAMTSEYITVNKQSILQCGRDVIMEEAKKRLAVRVGEKQAMRYKPY